MSPKEYADPEDEPQTPEEAEEVSEAGVQEQDEGTESKPMTMEERKAKMQQLRAKLVCPVLSLSHNCFSPQVTAVVCAGKPCFCDRRVLEIQNRCARPCAAREAAQTCGDAPAESGCGGARRRRREAEELGVDY